MNKIRSYISFGVVGLLISLADYPIIILIPSFYAIDLGLGLSAVALVFFIARITDIITDPLVGFISDKSQVSFKLWVGFGTPFYVVALYALFNPVDDVGAIQLGIILVLFYFTKTIIDVPHNALAASISSSDNSRLKLYGSKSIFMVLGVLVTGGIIAYQKGDISGSLYVLSLFTVCITLPILVLFFTGVPKNEQQEKKAYIWKDIWKIKSRVEGKFLLAFFLNQVGNSFAAGLVIIYIKDVLKLASMSGVFLGSLFISSALTIPFWIYMAKKHGKIRTWRMSIIAAAIIFSTVPFITDGSIMPYFLVCITAGACFGADAMLPPSILSDYSKNEWLKDSNITGSLFAIKSALSKASLALPIIIAFPILDLIDSKYPESSVIWIIFFYSVLPIFPKIIAYVIMGQIINSDPTAFS